MTPAELYIKERGYASYSSLKNLRDGDEPFHGSTKALDIGTETHSRWLEGVVLQIYDDEDEETIMGMVNALNKHKQAMALLQGSMKEVEFHCPLRGVMVKGYIDILKYKNLAYPSEHMADLKTLGHNNERKFHADMDFMQPAMYQMIKGPLPFYYIGVSKIKPHPIFIFNTARYPERIKADRNELINQLTYVKERIFNQ